MDFLKALMLYMTLTFSTAVQGAPTPEVTPVPTPAPTAVITSAPLEIPTVEPLVTPAPESKNPAITALPSTPTPEPRVTITPNPHYRNLKQGSRGTEVRKLQERLIELGYLKGSADGAYGGQTRRAVTQFQYYNGLQQDGIAGRATQTILFEDPDVIANPNTTPTPIPTASPIPTPEATAVPSPEELPLPEEPEADEDAEVEKAAYEGADADEPDAAGDEEGTAAAEDQPASEKNGNGAKAQTADETPAPTAEPTATPAPTATPELTPSVTAVPTKVPESKKKPGEDAAESPAAEAPEEAEASEEAPAGEMTEQPAEEPAEETVKARAEDAAKGAADEAAEPAGEQEEGPAEEQADEQQAPQAEPADEADEEPDVQPSLIPEDAVVMDELLLFRLPDALAVVNDAGDPLSLLKREDGVLVQGKPDLYLSDTGMYISLTDLCEATEGWTIEETDEGWQAVMAGYALSLRPYRNYTTWTAELDGKPFGLEASDISMEDGSPAISEQFLTRLIGAEITWDDEEQTMMIRVRENKKTDLSD